AAGAAVGFGHGDAAGERGLDHGGLEVDPDFVGPGAASDPAEGHPARGGTDLAALDDQTLVVRTRAGTTRTAEADSAHARGQHLGAGLQLDPGVNSAGAAAGAGDAQRAVHGTYLGARVADVDAVVVAGAVATGALEGNGANAGRLYDGAAGQVDAVAACNG